MIYMTTSDLRARALRQSTQAGNKWAGETVKCLDRIAELEAANAQWLDKWERQECTMCGSKATLGPSRDELLDALLDIRDPLSRAGVCIFCDQRVGLSVFSNELLNPGRHLKGCPWLARQQETQPSRKC